MAREESAEALLEMLAAPGLLAAFDKVNCATFVNRSVFIWMDVCLFFFFFFF